MDQSSQEMEILQQVSPAKLAQMQERLLAIAVDAHGRLCLTIQPEERDPSWMKRLRVIHIRDGGTTARASSICNLEMKDGAVHLTTHPCTIQDLSHSYEPGTLFLYLNDVSKNVGQHPLQRVIH